MVSQQWGQHHSHPNQVVPPKPCLPEPSHSSTRVISSQIPHKELISRCCPSLVLPGDLVALGNQEHSSVISPSGASLEGAGLELGEDSSGTEVKPFFPIRSS